MTETTRLPHCEECGSVMTFIEGWRCQRDGCSMFNVVVPKPHMTLKRTEEQWVELTTKLKHRLHALRRSYRELQRTYQLRNEDHQRSAGMYRGARKDATEWWEKWRLANNEVAARDAEIRSLKDRLLAATKPNWRGVLLLFLLIVASVLLGVAMAIAWGPR